VRTPDENVDLARALVDNHRRMVSDERAWAADSIADRGFAYLWTPARGVVRVTSLGDWDAIATGRGKGTH
jgi:hypothetical protein